MSGGDLPNIIAVDDDYAVRMGMEFMFKKWPEYNLFLAEDPNDALAKLDERDYMMMFSDINMPVMSGLDLLKIVKEKNPELPVVMLTSETDIQNSITAFRYGAMDYLLKPPTIATVRGAIDKAAEYLEEQTRKSSGTIDMGEFKDMVENFSPEKMGLTKSGSKSTEFTKLVNMLQEKLIHPGKIGRIHNLFLLSKSGIVISNLSAKNVEQTDVDILGGMFTAVKDFMEDAVSARTTSSLNDIQFGNFHVKFASGAFSELAVVYTGILNQEAEDSITDTLIAFELENMKILENWDGDMSKLENSVQHLEKLFGDIDKDKS
jgi:FixJ family two-component response regulator